MPNTNEPQQIECQFFCWPIYQRSNGVWYADGRSNGAGTKRTSLGTKNKQEAIANLHQLDRAQAQNQGLVPRSQNSTGNKRLSVKDGRRLFDDHTARPRLVGGAKPSTQKRYRAILDKFVTFLESKRITDWHQVTDRTLTDYAAYLEEREYAYKTVFGELNLLKTVFKWLSTEKHVDREPLTLKLRKADCQRAYCYTDAEVAAMIDLCRATPTLIWLHNVIVALACTGLRISELASLKWSDIRIDKRRLTISDESAFTGPTTDRRGTKNSRSRHIPIHSDLLAVFESLDHDGQYVFRGPRGGRLKPDTVRNILVSEVITPLSVQFPKPFPGQKSFEDGRLHSLRHYFCSRCANERVPERMVMEWLGHSDSEMVRHYYHLSDDESRRKMDQLNLLRGDGGRSGVEDEQTL